MSLSTKRLAPWRAVISSTCALFVAMSVQATNTVVSEGVAERPSTHVVLHNARIVTEPGRVIERGLVELRDGRIVSVAAGDKLPPGAEAFDLHGKTLFAGLIDLASTVGVPASMRSGGIEPGAGGQAAHEQQLAVPGARHWNRRVRPELSVASMLDPAADDISALRNLGFTAALAAPQAGIFRGQSALLSLLDAPRKNSQLLKADAAQHVGFDFAYGSEYPGSLMGAIALVRQTLLDARWQKTSGSAAGTTRVDENLALAALIPVIEQKQSVFFQLDDELDLARAAKLRSELDFKAVLLGTGSEYRVLDAARAAGLPIVLPINYPEAPMVEDADAAMSATLAELQHWEQAPANAARVAAAGVSFALTPNALKDPDKNFWPNVRKAVAAGLSEDAALKALTVTPASLLGESSRLGRINVGQLANLLVADAELFRSEEAKTFEVWVEGQRHVLRPIAPASAAGTWTLRWADGVGPAQWTATGDGDVLEIKADAHSFKLKRDGDQLIGLPPAALFGGIEGQSRVQLTLNERGARGFRSLADGRLVGVEATIVALGDEKPTADAKKKEADAIPSFVGYPAGEYARSLPVQPGVLLIRNAVLWTNTDQGVLPRADLLVRAGKIAAIGVDLDVPANTQVIDATGLQLTPGMVDAHSHTAIARGVNEGSHAVTTEVRIGDVLDPTDINIYRQLAGGVTSVNLLHGSANPMGGQSAVIKMRWGADAAGLLLQGAPGGIKFALGENVKQSNLGDAFTSRYPQTRMGVEQIIRDHLNAAKAYAAARAGKEGKAVRRDLRLEALAEILAGTRLIHIHSYRADELLMFVRLAEEFGIRGVTFQHVLEGYKVAPEIASIGAGASTFSDWWSFKLEAFDATPYQAVLLDRAGVPVSFNSDSDEMARRLNSEAAKAMKYGGMSAEDALKLVTLNPAQQLGIDNRVGALRSGLDADFVLWNGSPLSSMSRAQQTWIDGRRMFDRAEDAAFQQRDLAERERLLAKAGAARMETLSLSSADKPAVDSSDVQKEATAPAFGGAYQWLRYSAGRGLYNNGQTYDSCEVQAHGH